MAAVPNEQLKPRMIRSTCLLFTAPPGDSSAMIGSEQIAKHLLELQHKHAARNNELKPRHRETTDW